MADGTVVDFDIPSTWGKTRIKKIRNVYKALHTAQYTSNRAKNIILGHFSSHRDLFFWPIDYSR